MVEECLELLAVKEGGLYVDCTLGGGGHTGGSIFVRYKDSNILMNKISICSAILQKGGLVIGLDQDKEAIQKSTEVLQEYIQARRFEAIQSNFRNIGVALSISNLAGSRNPPLVDGILMDLGVSSHQIDEPSRGFAFGSDGPLDMRMSRDSLQSTSSLTAATIINEWDATQIADVLFQYGDEKRSRQIAREIVASRPLNSTAQLEKVISRITSFKERPKTLARCFQVLHIYFQLVIFVNFDESLVVRKALRIVVNDEMGALDEALTNIHRFIRPGGRLVVLSYHSLEDRRVKRLFRTGAVSGQKMTPTVFAGGSGSDSGAINPWIEVVRRAQAPSDEEIDTNRRARSAKLRAAERVVLPNEITDSTTLEGTNMIERSVGRKKKIMPLIGAKQRAKMISEENDDDQTM